MYARPDGATRAEILVACGGSQANAARELDRQGQADFMIARRSDGQSAYFLGPRGSAPGGPTARHVGRSPATAPLSQADQIRRFVIDRIIDPERSRGAPEISIVSGDVHRGMGLSNAMPAVCGALDAPLFLEQADVQLAQREGPANSSTVRWTFSLAASPLTPAVAESLLRERLGPPFQESVYIVSFATAAGRHLSLQRTTATTAIWVEDAGGGPPPVGIVRRYEASDGRNSNLAGRLKQNPPAEFTTQGFPRPVYQVVLSSRREVHLLLDWYGVGTPTIDVEALERLRVIFVRQFPDFEPLGFAGRGGGFFDVEDAHKRALVAEVQSLLDAEPVPDDRALGARVLAAIERSKLGTEFRLTPLLKRIAVRHPGSLEAATGRLARSDAPVTEATATFLEVVWPLLLEDSEGGKPYAESRILPTLILALVQPEDAVAISYQRFWNAANLLRGGSAFANTPLSIEEHAAILAMCDAIFDVMRDRWHWQPRDLWDVQGFIRTTCRDRLSDTAEAADTTIPKMDVDMPTSHPTNLILYGPPGTGKTFHSIEEAVRLCDGSVPDNRQAVEQRYRALVGMGQVEFVTFHQSYSYEDFVEGLRPTTGTEDEDSDEASPTGFALRKRDGVFRKIAGLAEQARKRGASVPFDVAGRRVFKMSLGRAGAEDEIYDAAIAGGYAVLGWGGDEDWSDPRYDDFEAIRRRWNELVPGTSGKDGNIAQLWCFRASIRERDLIVVSEGNHHFRAIGEIVGPYHFDPTGVRTYNHRRAVRWLLVLDESLPVDVIYGKTFSQVSCYQLRERQLKHEALARLIPGNPAYGSRPDQFVLIIDEINRANISKVFGELITLIEPDKRLGQRGELTVRLPYSGDIFGVPDNLHIVGTMNTADRSIALLDTALRRRFRFRELMPQPSVLAEREGPPGIDLAGVLATINERIEYLFDREHQIGHAYFMNCRTRGDLDAAMRDKVIPLLAEYFHEDWSRIAMVLGDGEGAGRFLERMLLRSPSRVDEAEPRYSWRVKDTFAADAYVFA